MDETRNHTVDFAQRKLNAGAKKFALYVVSNMGARTPIDEYEPDPDKSDSDVDMLESIEERALHQCNILGGTNVFALEALDAEGNAMGHDVFRISAEAMPGAGSMLSTEPANEAGHNAQMMRHTEVMFRQSTIAMDKANRIVASQMERMARRMEQGEDKYLEALEVFEKARGLDHERSMEAKQLEASIDLKAQGLEKLSRLVPMALAEVGGKKATGSDAAVAGLARNMLESLDMEQLGALRALLNPEQQLEMMAVMKRLATDAEAVKKAKAAAAEGAKTKAAEGETDARH